MASSTLHPALATTLAALRSGGVRWCLLRGEGELDQAREDVDLLIGKEDLLSATTMLHRLGYLQLPSWGRGSHRFFVAYDCETDSWTKLDVVTSLSFGQYAEFETGAAALCLIRRTESGPLYLLHETDGFWALLLHCLLDRNEFPARHQERLVELSNTADETSPLSDWFERWAPDHWSAERVHQAIRAGEWNRLGEMGRAMRGSLGRRHAGARLIRARRALLQRLTKLRTLVAGRGLTVALLGPDGAGKSTLAEGLARTFFFPARTIYMGLYGRGPSGRPPRGLAGRLRRQWEGYARGVMHAARGRLVVYDRWGFDARLGAKSGRGIRDRFRRWLLAESLPDPDLVILLDAPPELLLARKGEHDIETLRVQRNAYLDLVETLDNTHVVPADHDPETVRRVVTALIWKTLRSRRNGDAPEASA